MDERNEDRMDDEELDAFIESGLPDMAPDDVALRVNPWRRTLGRVIAGLALQIVTLNFLYLNYLLPAIGASLALLGFRALRRENRWFAACFYMEIAVTAYLAAANFLSSAIFGGEILASRVWHTLFVMKLLAPMPMFFCLWRGLFAVQRRAEVDEGAPGAVWFIVWYAIILLVGLMGGVKGLAPLIIGLTAYILILRSVYKLYRSLDEAGYAVRPSPVKIGDRWLAWTVLGVFAAAVACGFAFRSYPMEWSPWERQESRDTEEIAAELRKLGFPESVLEDLREEEIRSLDGVTHIEVSEERLTVEDGRFVTVYDGSGDLVLTSVAVKLPRERETWSIIHHFEWISRPEPMGTEAINILPTARAFMGWGMDGEIAGRVLCTIDGQTCEAPYYFLGTRASASNGSIFAEFSLPREGDNCRGYVIYTAQQTIPGYIIDSWAEYVHQCSPSGFPVRTAAAECIMGLWMSDNFCSEYTAIQFYPYAEEDQE